MMEFNDTETDITLKITNKAFKQFIEILSHQQSFNDDYLVKKISKIEENITKLFGKVQKLEDILNSLNRAVFYNLKIIVNGIENIAEMIENKNHREESRSITLDKLMETSFYSCSSYDGFEDKENINPNICNNRLSKSKLSTKKDKKFTSVLKMENNAKIFDHPLKKLVLEDDSNSENLIDNFSFSDGNLENETNDIQSSSISTTDSVIVNCRENKSSTDTNVFFKKINNNYGNFIKSLENKDNFSGNEICNETDLNNFNCNDRKIVSKNKEDNNELEDTNIIYHKLSSAYTIKNSEERYKIFHTFNKYLETSNLQYDKNTTNVFFVLENNCKIGYYNNIIDKFYSLVEVTCKLIYINKEETKILVFQDIEENDSKFFVRIDKNFQFSLFNVNTIICEYATNYHSDIKAVKWFIFFQNKHDTEMFSDIINFFL